MVLLCDYELLGQGINGLEIIEQSGIERVSLVTSHYSNPKVREDALDLDVRITPKQLAGEIVIEKEV